MFESEGRLVTTKDYVYEAARCNLELVSFRQSLTAYRVEILVRGSKTDIRHFKELVSRYRPAGTSVTVRKARIFTRFYLKVIKGERILTTL